MVNFSQLSRAVSLINFPARMEDRILQLEKQCRTLSAQVDNTKKQLDGVIDQQKQDVGALLLKLQKMEQSVTSTKDWTTQKVIFALESLYLLGNGMHAALLDLVTKMTNIPEEIGALAKVESDESVVKVKELLERAKPQWEEMIRVLEARLPCAQEVHRRESGSVISPPTQPEHAPPRSPGQSDAIEVAPVVSQSALAPTSDAPQSPIMADQQLTVTPSDGVAPVPTSHLSPTAPSSAALELTRTGQDLLPIIVAGPSSPLTTCASHPASPIDGDDQNTRKRKATEEVDVDIARKKPSSHRKKGPPALPQRKQPPRGRSKAPEGDPATPGQPDTIMEEDAE